MDPRSSPHFIQLDAPERPVFPIAEGRTTLGRDTSSDLCLPDSSISREHCYFERQGAAVRVFDSNSKNPSRIGKEPADGRTLSDGDVLRLGRSRLLFKNPLASPGEQASAIAPSTSSDSPAAGADPESRGRRERVSRRRALRFPRRPRRVALGAVALLLVALSVAAGVVVGRVLLNGQGSGTPWSRLFGASSPSGAEDSGDVHLSRRLQMIEELLSKQADEISRIQAELESNRVRFENLPLHLQNEIDFYRSRNAERQDRELARVRGQLGELQERLGGERGRSPRAVTLEELGLKPIEEPGDTRVEVEDYAGKTVVARPPAVRKKLGAPEIRKLVTALKESLDEYAMPGITAAILQPRLGELSSAPGKTAARGVIEVYDHGRSLLRDVDNGMRVREKWVRGLLKKAEDEGLNRKGEGSASKGGYGASSGEDHEEEQRLLELSAKKVAILKKQRQQLMALQHAILDSLSSFTDSESTACLADRFGSDDDRELRLAILEVLGKARAAHSVPKLTLHLHDRDDELRAAVHRTLVAIAGEDLGESAGPWRDWWAQRKEG